MEDEGTKWTAGVNGDVFESNGRDIKMPGNEGKRARRMLKKIEV